MYLAQQHVKGGKRWFIRESYAEGTRLLSRNLMDLGPNPGRYIVYPGGNAFYIHENIGDRLDQLCVSYRPEDLDDLFYPFLNREIRYRLEWVAHRGVSRQPGRPKMTSERSQSAMRHPFDKRRLHFLKFGRMRQKNLDRMPDKWFHPMDGKSRDEVEQYFITMETRLKPREVKQYVFVSLDLQRHFTQQFAPTAPHILDPEEVDDHLIKEVCRIHRDRQFWRGQDPDDRLHPYLVRYLVMYFDFDYPTRGLWENLVKQFMDGRRDYHPPKRVVIKMKRIAELFGTSPSELKRMTREELARLFRRKAQKLHPDKGGSHDAFVELAEAYHRLLRGKN